MSSLKTKIKDGIVSSRDRYYETYENEATVIAIDKSRKTCDITYINRDNVKTTKEDVAVSTSGKGLFSWFPEVGDIVAVKENDYKVIIERPFQSATEAQTDLEADRYAFIMSEVGGNMFY